MTQKIFYFSGLAYIAVSIMLFCLTLPIGLVFKIGTFCLVLIATLLSLLKAWRHFAPIENVPLRPFLFCFVITCLCYVGLFKGHTFVGDWGKHRSVLLSLYQSPFQPTLSGFALPPTDPLKQSSLIYYYLPYVVPAFLMKAFPIDENPIPYLQFTFLATTLLSMFWGLFFFAGQTKELLTSPAKTKSAATWFFILLVFWGGADFWWARFWMTPPLPHFSHMDGVYGGQVQFQVHAIHSLLIWVPCQLGSLLVGAGIITPFRNLRDAPVSLGAATILLGNPVGGIGAIPFVLMFWWRRLPKKQWPPIVNCLESPISTILTVLGCLWFFSLRLNHDVFGFNHSIKGQITNFLVMLLRDFGPFLISLMFLYRKSVISLSRMAAFLFATLWPMMFYMGHFNMWTLKVGMFSTVVGCSLGASALATSKGLERVALALLFMALMGPGFINEYVFALDVKHVYLEPFRFLIQQYAGPVPNVR
jgi:hypothetical protein